VRERAGDGELAAVDSILSYLERSAVRHEEDEEASLFPRLRGVADLGPLLDDLAAEHVAHRQLVRQLSSLRSGWPPSGPDVGDRASLVILANELARTLRAHIDREERELLPAAREHLGPADRQAIRAEMTRRRDPAG
jgi:hemerythrin-like domain-containing protein